MAATVTAQQSPIRRLRLCWKRLAVIGAIYAATEGRCSWFAFPTLMGAWFAKSTRLKRGHDE